MPPNKPDEEIISESGSPGRFELDTDQERRMDAELGSINEALSSIYKGAKYALTKEENPDCLRQASVSMRELFDALPRYDARIPDRVDVEGQRDMINRLSLKWQPITGMVSRPFSELTDAEIEKVREYLTQSQVFFEWHNTHSLSARQQQQLIIDTYDPRQSSLPNRSEVLDSWMKYRKFFNDVTHTLEVGAQEFKDKLSGFEELFLTIVVPQTVDDFEELDEIISEVQDE